MTFAVGKPTVSPPRITPSLQGVAPVGQSPTSQHSFLNMRVQRLCLRKRRVYRSISMAIKLMSHSESR